MKIVKDTIKEKVDGVTKRRVEYLVKDSDGLVAVFQRKSEAEKFVALVKAQGRG